VNDKLPPSLNRFAAELEHAIRRELTPRRDRRLGRVLRARPRLLAGTTVGAASIGAIVALVLSAAGSSPAFAVTRHRDGSYTVAVRSLTAIPAANHRLSQLGVRAWIAKMGPGCNTALLPNGQAIVRITPRPSRSATTVIAAWRNGNQVKVASSMTQAAATACVPPCPGGGANWVAPNVHPTTVGNGPGSASSGNSGNSGNSGSGNSGNSGSSGTEPAATVRARARARARARGGSSSSSSGYNWTRTTIVCPAPPPPGGGNSGNSGNSGSGNS
jgi:hypothetical protein